MNSTRLCLLNATQLMKEIHKKMEKQSLLSKFRGYWLPREVLFAEDLTTSGVALVGELYVAVCALEALGVPRLVQDLQDEPIDNGTVAASTDRDVSCVRVCM